MSVKPTAEDVCNRLNDVHTMLDDLRVDAETLWYDSGYSQGLLPLVAKARNLYAASMERRTATEEEHARMDYAEYRWFARGLCSRLVEYGTGRRKWCAEPVHTPGQGGTFLERAECPEPVQEVRENYGE